MLPTLKLGIPSLTEHEQYFEKLLAIDTLTEQLGQANTVTN